MLYESQQFQNNLPKSSSWSEHVFKFCDFKDIQTEGGVADSIYIGCNFEKCEWYWGLFCLAVFIEVTFKSCTFRGTSFNGSKFVECEFIGCVFKKDNLNAQCSFDDVAWYKCNQNNCIGLEEEFRNKK